MRTVPIVYVGPADAVTLAPEAGGIHFPAGVPVEVPEGLAASLLEQDTFRRHKPLRGPSRGSAAGANPDVETR